MSFQNPKPSLALPGQAGPSGYASGAPSEVSALGGTDIASAALDNYGSVLSMPTALVPPPTAPGARPGVVPFSALTDPAAAESKIRALEASLRDKEGAMRNLEGGGSEDDAELPDIPDDSVLPDLDFSVPGSATAAQPATDVMTSAEGRERPLSSFSLPGGMPPPPSDVSAASASQWEPLVAALRATLSSRDDRLHRTIGLIETLAREMEELNARLLAGKENEDRLVRSHRVLRTVYQARVDGLKTRADKLAFEADEAKKAALAAQEELRRTGAAAGTVAAAGVAASAADLAKLEREKEQMGQRIADLQMSLNVAVEDAKKARLKAEEAQRQAERAQREARELAASAASAAANAPTAVQGPPVSESLLPGSSSLRPHASQASGAARAVGGPQDLSSPIVAGRAASATSMRASLDFEASPQDLAYLRAQVRYAEQDLAGSPGPGVEPGKPPAGVSPIFPGMPATGAGGAAMGYAAANAMPPFSPGAPVVAQPLSDPEQGIRELATAGTKMALVSGTKRFIKQVRIIPRGNDVPVLVWTDAGKSLFGKPKEESSGYRRSI